MCCIKFYSLFLFYSIIIVKSQIFQYTDVIKPGIGECVKDFIETFMEHENKYVSISEGKPALNNTIFKSLAIFMRMDFELEASLSKLDFIPLTYVVFLDNVNNFNDTFISIKASKVYSTHSRLLIITNTKQKIQNIAQDLWERKMLRSNILLINKNNVEIHSMKIIDCGFKIETNEIVLSKAINCGSVKVEVDLKAMLKSCPIYVITCNMQPFVNPENETLKGIFMEMLDVFSQVSQRQLIVRPYDSIYLDELLQAYNLQPVVDAFVSGYADIFIGPIHHAASTVMDIGPDFVSNNLLFLVPREFISGPIDILFFAHNTDLTIMFIGTTCVVVTLNFFARHTADRQIFGSITKTLFLIIGMLLNTAFPSKMPTNRKLQLFLISLMFASMIWNTYLQGIIISILNGPSYEQPIKSIRELLQKKIPIRIFPTLAFYFGYNNKGLECYQEIYERLTMFEGGDMFESTNTILRDRHFAGTSYEGFLTMRPNLQSSFSIIEFLTNHHAAGMPKNYYMHKEFCEWFQQMIEHGIITKFSKLYKFSYALKYYVETDTRLYRVTMKQMEPTLVMLLFAYLFALFAFILELVFYKITQLVKVYRCST